MAILLGTGLALTTPKISNALENSTQNKPYIAAAIGYDALRNAPIVGVEAGIPIFKDINLTGKVSAGKVKDYHKSVDMKKHAEKPGAPYKTYSGDLNYNGKTFGVQAGAEFKLHRNFFAGVNAGAKWDVGDLNSNLIRGVYYPYWPPVEDSTDISEKIDFSESTFCFGATLKLIERKWVFGVGADYTFSPQYVMDPETFGNKVSLFEGKKGVQVNISAGRAF